MSVRAAAGQRCHHECYKPSVIQQWRILRPHLKVKIPQQREVDLRPSPPVNNSQCGKENSRQTEHVAPKVRPGAKWPKIPWQCGSGRAGRSPRNDAIRRLQAIYLAVHGRKSTQIAERNSKRKPTFQHGARLPVAHFSWKTNSNYKALLLLNCHIPKKYSFLLHGYRNEPFYI